MRINSAEEQTARQFYGRDHGSAAATLGYSPITVNTPPVVLVLRTCAASPPPSLATTNLSPISLMSFQECWIHGNTEHSIFF